VKVRVIDLASGTDGSGQAIDVWAGSGPGSSSSKKLATVDYATRSDELTPLRSSYSQPQDRNGKQVYGYQLWFVPKGATTTDAGIYQNGDAYPGDELTVLVYTTPGSTTARSLGFLAYYFKAADHGDGTRTTFQDIAAPSGSKLVALDAHGVKSPAYDPANPTSTAFDLSAGSGCLPEVKPKGSITSDANSRYTISTESVPDFAYVLKGDASSVEVTKVATGVTTEPQCSHTVATVVLPDSASDHVLVFLYGDPAAPKALVEPG